MQDIFHNKLAKSTVRTFGILFLICGLFGCRILAATFTVTTTADDGAGSLRQAIISAGAGDTINFDPAFFGGANPRRIIDLTGGELLINKSLTITGTGARNLVVRRSANAAANFRIFDISGNSTVNISGLSITNGNVTGDGGGMLIQQGTVTLTGVQISNNTATVYAGGIRTLGGTLTILNSTISNNTANANAGFGGGGIDNDSTLIVTSSTISGNRITGGNNNGGGIGSGGNVTITSSTITDNAAAGTGSAGGVISGVNQITVRNTIIAGNRNNTVTPDVTVIFGGFTSQGYNLIGNPGPAAFNQMGDQKGNSVVPVNPQLNPLGNDGGQTDTHKLLLTSTAIDKGNSFNLTTDQRGFTRPLDLSSVANGTGDKADIGAFERQENEVYSDLSITKMDLPDPVNAGSNITYTININNFGPDNAATAALTDTLPVNTTFQSITAPAGWSCTTPAIGASGTVSCSNSSFAPGSAGFTLTAAVAPSAASGTVISNTATVSSITADQEPGNNSAAAATTVVTSADLSITKTNGAAAALAGGPVTYTITASNIGPSNASMISLTDALPANTTFVSLTQNSGSPFSCTTPAVGANGTVTCTIATLTSGASASFTLIVNVDPNAVNGTSLTNTANISSATSDPNTTNNSSSATTPVTAQSDLSVTKTDAPDPVTAGNNIAYTINVTNNGANNAAGTVLTDNIPANTTFQFISIPAGFTCTTPPVGGTGTVICSSNANVLANGATAAFILVVNVNTGTADGTITNTASVSSSNPDPVMGNNTASASTTVAEYTSPAPTGLPPKALLVKPAAGNPTAGGGASDSSCIAPTGVIVAGVFANINQALGAAGSNGDTIYVCPKYSGSLVVPYVEQVSLGFTNLSVIGISDAKGSRAVIAANPSTLTSPTTQLGTNYIVQIVATGVNFGNFVIDGAPGGINFANTGIFNGIVVRRSGAFVFNNTVQNIRTADTAINANGQGIAVFGAGSAGSPIEAGTISTPVNILNNVVQTYRSNGVDVSAGSSSAYSFVRGNYIIGNGANSGTVNQTGLQFQTGANGDVFNNRITRILDNVAGCSAAAFGNCSAGIRLNMTASSSVNNLRVRFNLISNTQTGIFAQDVQYVSMTSNTISNSVIDGINLRGSALNLGSNFSTISQNTILSARRSGIFIGLIGGDASLGNNLTQNTIEDAFTGVANNPPAGNNTIPTGGITANTFISVNNFVGNATSGAGDVRNINPLP